MALIIDTDIGGDPDDAIAVAIAALNVPELALVITSDEVDGERARFARHYLDLLGRPDVPVAAGRQLSETRYRAIADLTPTAVPAQSGDVLGAVDRIIDSAEGVVRWCGMGPLSNLVDVLGNRPDSRKRLRITQMGGAINHRRLDGAEHNFRLDPVATAVVISTAVEPRLIISDVTFRPEIDVTAEHWLYQALRDDPRPWARVTAAHMDQWFREFVSGTMQHDSLALSAALGIPFVEFDCTSVAITGDARMRPDPGGAKVHLAREARYGPFMQWVGESLGLAVPGGSLAEG